MEDPISTPKTQISIFNVVAVIISAYFAMESAKIVSFVTSIVNRHTKPKESPKVTNLKAKIGNLRAELHGISPTGQFALYFKKEREINKLDDELEALNAENGPEMTRNLKINTAVRVVLQLSALVLLRYVSSITAFCIPNSIFWPFNFIVRFPAIFGNDSCPSEFAEVSGFAVAFLMISLIFLLLKYIRKIPKNAKNN